MNERFDTESRKALIDYRLQRAVETLKEADYNAAGNYFNTAVNRLYYAAFYATSALMLAYEVECSTHSGIKSMLSLKFVRTGLLARKHGKTFMQLFENRQTGDYEDFIYCDEELYSILRPKTEDFIIAIKSLILTNPELNS